MGDKMKKSIFFIIIFLIFSGFKEVDTVTRIIDGDTIETKNNGRIRILGIDAYDSNNSRMIIKQKERTNLSEYEIKELARRAKEFARKELLGKKVELEKDRRNYDRYNRKLRYVKVNGEDYSEKLLKAKLANTYCDDNNIRLFNYYNKISNNKCE